jgi:ABC-type spermidine/putrescine transport system permease subunit II
MRSRPRKSGGMGFLAGTYVAVCFLILFAPLAVLLLFSFNKAGTISLPFTGFSLEWFRSLLNEPDAVQAFKSSMIVAAIVTPICILAGLTSAYAAARLTGAWKGLCLGVFSIPLVVPWLVIGVAGLLFFTTIGVQTSTLTVIVMQVVVTFPLITLILYARLAGMSESVEEAAFDLGSGRIGVLCRVVLPQLVTPIIVSALFAFISSLGNFVVTFFVSGYNVTIPVWAYSSLRHAQDLPVVNAASTVMLAITVIVFGLVYLLTRRDGDDVSWL